MKVAFFGFSNIFQRRMFNAFSENKNFLPYSLACQRINSNVVNFADKHRLALYDNYVEMINNSEYDAAYISLPNSMHYDICELLLKKKVHCLVEKPIAYKSDINHLIDLAEQNDLALLENFQFQHHEQYKYFLQLLHDECLGEARSLSIYFGFPRFKDLMNIRYQPYLDGGALLDAGAYISKIASLLLSDTYSGVSISSKRLSSYNVDMFGSALFQSTNTFTVVGHWGFANSYRCQIDAWCEKGSIKIPRLFTPPPGEVVRVLTSTLNTVNEKEFVDDAYSNILDHFFKCISSKEYRASENTKTKQQCAILKDMYSKI